MNFKTTGILVALVLVVGAVWLFLPRSAPPAAQPAAQPFTANEREQDVLSPKPERDGIVRLTVEPAGKPRLVFERGPKPDKPAELGDWQAREPVPAPADTMVVNGQVSLLTSLRSRTRLEPQALSDADAGLAPPAAVATLVDKNGKEYKLEIGRKAPMSNDTYVRVAGQSTIHAVTTDLGQLRRDFETLRDKRLVTATPTDAVRLELSAEGQHFVFTRGEDGKWVIDVPTKAYAVSENVVGLVRKFTQLRAQSFVDDREPVPARYGLDHPYLLVSIVTESNKPLPAPETQPETQPAEPQFETVRQDYSLAIGGFADLQNENRYVRIGDQPWLARVREEDVKGLLPDLSKLRDPRVTRIDASEATRLELTVGGETATLEKVNDAWQGQGDLAQLESAAVADLLRAFELLTAVDYVLEPGDAAQYGLDAPRAVIRVTTQGAVEPITLEVGGRTPSGHSAYVRRAGQPTVYVVSAAAADQLVVPPLALRSRDIFITDAERMVALTVERSPIRYELLRAGTAWQMREPAGAPVGDKAVETVVSDLARLRARRVAGKVEDAARFGLDMPAITFRFSVAAAEETPESAPADGPPATPPPPPVEHTLQIGTQGTAAYARFDDQSYVYELDPTIHAVLTAELIERGLFRFQPEDIAGLTIVSPAVTLEFARSGQNWKFAPDPFLKLDAKKMGDLARDVAALRVERYEQYQDADLAAAGLLDSPITVSIRLKDDQLANLKLAAEADSGAATRLAGWVEEKRLFRLRGADVDKLLRPLDQYIESAATKKPPAEPEEPPLEEMP